MCNAKQPPVEIDNRSSVRERIDRLNQCILNHVLAIDHGAGHACAISVKLWPQFAERSFKGRARFLCTGSWWAHTSAFMRSGFANHAVVPDDGCPSLLRKLDAAVFEVALEQAERLLPRNRAGAIFGLRDADMNESVVIQPQGEIPDFV